MSWRNVRLITLREVRDQLRDRRTLFMIVVLPLLLYPLMGIGTVQMQFVFLEQPRTVVVLGAENLPEDERFRLVEENRFVRNWFSLTTSADKLDVVTDLPPANSDEDEAKRETSAEAAAREHREELLGRARQIQAKLRAREALEDELVRRANPGRSVPPPDPAFDRSKRSKSEVERELELVRADLGRLFGESRMQVLIIFPEGFAEGIQEVNERIAGRSDTQLSDVEVPRPLVIRNSADEKSRIAYGRVTEALGEWEQAILADRLEKANLPGSITQPVDPDAIELANKEEFAANVWSKIFPALLVVMCVTGAFYPAIDVAAGEKERGTMETLLICPASRSEIVLGKFFTVMCFSVCTALLNLVSMGITAWYMLSMKGGNSLASRLGDVSFPGPGPIAWIVVLSLPLAALFSALCLSLATFARSSKEGQYYLTPLLMVTLGLTVFCLSPGVELQPFYTILPVVGPALLLKELLASAGGTGPLMYAVPVLVTSVGYCFLALWWAIEQFGREDVLFREAERFELGLWVRQLLRDKEATPSFAEAGVCFVLILFLMFGAIRFFAGFVTDAENAAHANVQLIMIQQLVIIATPALLMGVMFTTSPWRTFGIKLPDWRVLVIGAALPFVLHPLAVGLQQSLGWFFPPLPDWALKQLGTMVDPNMNVWLIVLAFAVFPGVCEEIAFRGFILSGFNHAKRPWLAITLSAICFGVIHMIPQQVFNATLLGLVLGLLAIRSGSLLPGVVFHIVNNSLAILYENVARGRITDTPINWTTTGTGEEMRYHWAVLVVCALVASYLLRWLVRLDLTKRDEADEWPSVAPPDPPASRVVSHESVGVS